jgi:hypothetical protein
MRLMSRLLVSVALLCIAMFTVEATTRDRAGLDWQTFQVPEYGTHVEYPARLFAPVGEAKRASVSALRAKTGGRSYPSTPARIRTTIHLLVISERTYANPCSIMNGSPALSLRSQWNEMGQSFIADATSPLAIPPYIVSTWCIHKAKKRPGTLW